MQESAMKEMVKRASFISSNGREFGFSFSIDKSPLIHFKPILSFLKWIEPISFENLKELNVSNNRCMNVESLAFMKLENIERIDISCNLVTSTKVFSKCNFPQLKLLNSSNNRLSTLDMNRTALDTTGSCQLKMNVVDFYSLMKLSQREVSMKDIYDEKESILSDSIGNNLFKRFLNKPKSN